MLFEDAHRTLKKGSYSQRERRFWKAVLANANDAWDLVRTRGADDISQL
jgi:hypothetical protein